MNTLSKNKIDLTGSTFGKIKVIRMEFADFREKRRWVSVCECECGKKDFIVLPNELVRLKVKSCGCSRKNKQCGKDNPSYTGYEEISGQRWSQIKACAKARDIDFNVTMEDCWKKFEAQKGKCALSGLDIAFGKKGTDRYTASLDRIDSKRGYTLDNVQWVHVNVNCMKSDFDEPYFFDLCKRIIEFTSKEYV